MKTILTLLLMRWQEAPRSGWLLIAGGLAGLMFLTRYAAVGFVVLSGVAVLDDMLLVSYIRQLRDLGVGLD